ncbi:MAG: hypothetical protein ACRDX8_07470 [Acidimicrobiales bacterium]
MTAGLGTGAILSLVISPTLTLALAGTTGLVRYRANRRADLDHRRESLDMILAQLNTELTSLYLDAEHQREVLDRLLVACVSDGYEALARQAALALSAPQVARRPPAVTAVG